MRNRFLGFVVLMLLQSGTSQGAYVENKGSWSTLWGHCAVNEIRHVLSGVKGYSDLNVTHLVWDREDSKLRFIKFDLFRKVAGKEQKFTGRMHLAYMPLAKSFDPKLQRTTTGDGEKTGHAYCYLPYPSNSFDTAFEIYDEDGKSVVFLGTEFWGCS